MKLTIAYITCREDPLIEHFYTSLAPQTPNNLKPRLVVVDHFKNERMLAAPHAALASKLSGFIYTNPKPSVWQGAYRRTAVDFFSASNARNTALCFSGDSDYIIYVDDCCFLGNQWLNNFLYFPKFSCVLMGSYAKVNVLTDGFRTIGEDYRLRLLRDEPYVKASPRFLLGCTVAIPVQHLLDVNGWPEFDCDGMGYEDCITGVVISNRTGCDFFFAREMKIYESEPAHHAGPKMLRIDPGQSPNDKSHLMWKTCKDKTKFDQYFGGGITLLSDLKSRIERHDPWPIPDGPTREYFTNIPLEEFHNYKAS